MKTQLNESQIFSIGPDTLLKTLLTTKNFQSGFLVDEELMGGVTKNPDNPESYVAFVLDHLSGEYLGYQPFDHLQAALTAINQIQRDWSFEKTSGCGEGNCGEGKCDKGSCKVGKC